MLVQARSSIARIHVSNRGGHRATSQGDVFLDLFEKANVVAICRETETGDVAKARQAVRTVLRAQQEFVRAKAARGNDDLIGDECAIGAFAWVGRVVGSVLGVEDAVAALG